MSATVESVSLIAGELRQAVVAESLFVFGDPEKSTVYIHGMTPEIAAQWIGVLTPIASKESN